VFTSATAAFTGADVGATLVQIATTGDPDNPGAIPTGTTITSVTNATTVVMSQVSPNTSTGIRTLLGGRVPPATQPLLQFYDVDGATSLGQVRRSGLSWFSPVDLKTNAPAIPTLKVSGMAGQTSEILTVLKDGNASGCLSILATGLVAMRFGTSASNAADTTKNSVDVTNYSTTANTVQIKGAAGGTGSQLAIQDSGGVNQSRFNKDGRFCTAKSTIPALGDLANGEVSLWVDPVTGDLKVTSRIAGALKSATVVVA
jgi:hypothetical protein